MEVINNIYLDRKKENISYFFPIKLKAPFFKRIGKKQDFKVSGSIKKGEYTNEHAIIFTVSIYHAQLTISPVLLTLCYANECFPCREIKNDSFIKEREYKLKGDSNYRTSRERVHFSTLLFEVPTSKLLFYLERKSLTITVNFPKVKFKAILKRQKKDHVEYVARFCSNRPIPQRLTDRINNEEKTQKKAFLTYLIVGIIIPIIAIIVIINIPREHRLLPYEQNELLLKCLASWPIVYSLIHFLIIRNIIGKNKSFLFRLLTIFD